MLLLAFFASDILFDSSFNLSLVVVSLSPIVLKCSPTLLLLSPDLTAVSPKASPIAFQKMPKISWNPCPILTNESKKEILDSTANLTS
ncbi:hypothetical protein BHY_1473 (plasmid) [Borrelia nietonii YOR]|uniref:Uncharacterized protein n=2 Tax=Borrelia TaxID=138 RepID=W5SCN9_9SPIR|nr:hypothetical protein BHY_1473 [Borrelia nietonii YOR]AHH14762.1 hypothetical protein BHW_0900061 [Borrelia hermsii MTW]